MYALGLYDVEKYVKYSTNNGCRLVGKATASAEGTATLERHREDYDMSHFGCLLEQTLRVLAESCAFAR